MRGRVVVVVCALLGGCGRVGFDVTDDGGASTSTCVPRDPITGATWWVSPTGNDASSGAMDTPVATITHAVALAAASTGGGTIVVLEGSYVSEGEIIVGTTVPLRILSKRTYRATIQRMLCLSCTDLTIEGFEVTGSATLSGLQTSGGRRVVIRDNVVHDIANSGIRISGSSMEVDVLDNLVYDTATTPLHVAGAFNVTLARNVTFRANLSSTIQSMIWIETGDAVTVSSNVLFRSRGTDIEYGVIGLRTTSNTVVENNVIGGAPDATGVYAALGFDQAAGSATIRHNTFIGPFPGPGFGLGVDTTLPSAAFRISNNLFVSAGTTQAFTSGVAPSMTVVLDRNLYWNGPTGPFTLGGFPGIPDDPQAIIADPKVSFALPAVPTWSATSQTFADGSASVCEIHAALVDAMAPIPATSPAVGKADPASSSSVDIRGRVRPPAATIGAYEPD